MRDRDVRDALRRKVFVEHIRDSKTLVVEELGVLYGEARVDVAVVNGRLHGFEIKSDTDTLARLNAQMTIYNGIFDRMTIVVGNKHVADVSRKVPQWWGIKVATAGRRGAVHFEEARAPLTNLLIDPLWLATLLWREEAVAVLEEAGERGVRSRNRAQLCSILAEKFSLDELRGAVRTALKARVNWRSDAQRVPCAD
jgi:hypothetical protein